MEVKKLEYNVTATGTLDGTHEFSFRKQVTCDSVQELKDWFKQEMAVICFKQGASTFTGTVTVDKREWSNLVTDRDFDGTFDVQQSIVIDF